MGQTPETPRRVAPLVGGAIAAALTAALLLLAARQFLEADRLHVHGSFNDQAGYVTTARHWVDTGELASGLVYPSRLEDPRWRPYMPGHYAALAASFRLLGWSVEAALLPSLLAFALTVGLIHAVVATRMGHARAALASGLFATFSPNLAYASTAMAETTFTAAGTVAVAAFLFVPRSLRALVVAPLLVLPFLFRETGALLVVPMLVLILLEERRRTSWLSALLALVGSVALLWLVQAWQVADGKGSPTLEWITADGFNYDDAFPPEPAELTPWELPAALAGNAARNLGTTGRWLAGGLDSMGAIETVLLFLATLVLAVHGLRSRRPLPLAAGALGLVGFAFAYALYDTPRVKLMRGLLFATPLLAIGLATLDLPRALGATPGRRRAALAAVGVAYLALNAYLAAGTRRVLTAKDPLVDRFTFLLDSLEPPVQGLLVAPHELSLDFAVLRYPVRWSFVPANDESLRAVHEAAGPIETLVLPEDDLEDTRRGPTPAAARELGLEPARVFQVRGERYVVLRPIR